MDVVYLILSEVPKEMFGAKFTFSLESQKDGSYSEPVYEPVYTPTREELKNVEDFLYDFVGCVEDKNIQSVKKLR